MRTLPFHKDKPINENSPGFNYYRASLSLIKYLRNESSFWRATCNHDTKPHNDDFMESYFTTLDVMTHDGRFIMIYSMVQQQKFWTCARS